LSYERIQLAKSKLNLQSLQTPAVSHKLKGRGRPKVTPALTPREITPPQSEIIPSRPSRSVPEEKLSKTIAVLKPKPVPESKPSKDKVKPVPESKPSKDELNPSKPVQDELNPSKTTLIGANSSKSHATLPVSRPHSSSESSLGSSLGSTSMRRVRRCHNCNSPTTNLLWLALDKSDMTVDKFSTIRLSFTDVQPDIMYCDNEDCEEALNLFIDKQLENENTGEKRKRLELLRPSEGADNVDSNIKDDERVDELSHAKPSFKRPRLQEGISSKIDEFEAAQVKSQIPELSKSGLNVKNSREQHKPSDSKSATSQHKPNVRQSSSLPVNVNGPNPTSSSVNLSTSEGVQDRIDLTLDSDDDDMSQHDSQSCPTDVVDGDKD
jgi:hypothetical protein